MTIRNRLVFIASLCVSLLAGLALAETLVWDRNPEPDVVGYVVSYGVVGTTVTNAVFTPTNSLALTNTTLFPRGSYYWFYVRATNSAGLLSGPSELVLSSLMRNVTNANITQ